MWSTVLDRCWPTYGGWCWCGVVFAYLESLLCNTNTSFGYFLIDYIDLFVCVFSEKGVCTPLMIRSGLETILYDESLTLSWSLNRDPTCSHLTSMTLHHSPIITIHYTDSDIVPHWHFTTLTLLNTDTSPHWHFTTLTLHHTDTSPHWHCTHWHPIHWVWLTTKDP